MGLEGFLWSPGSLEGLRPGSFIYQFGLVEGCLPDTIGFPPLRGKKPVVVTGFGPLGSITVGLLGFSNVS